MRFKSTIFYKLQILFQVMDERLDFSQTWPDKLREVTTYTYGWSFVVAWLGMFSTLMASILFYLSYKYFWVPEGAKPIVAEGDLPSCSDKSGGSVNNNNSPQSGNSAETCVVEDDAADLTSIRSHSVDTTV